MLDVFLVGATNWDKEIVAEKLTIVDEIGNIQAVLGGDSKGPSFFFYDPDGKPRM